MVVLDILTQFYFLSNCFEILEQSNMDYFYFVGLGIKHDPRVPVLSTDGRSISSRLRAHRTSVYTYEGYGT